MTSKHTSAIAPNKMPKFDAYESMARLADIGYKCIEISQVPMSKENVAGFRRAIDELGFNVAAVSANTAASPIMPGTDMSNPDEMKKMIEDGRDCSDVLIQLSAIKSEITGVSKVILKDHIDHCIVDAVKENDEDAIEHLKGAIDKLL